MKRLGCALGVGWCALASPARALEITPGPISPVAIGEAHTFRIASVLGASGDTSYRWNFGDGTTVGPGAAGEVEHTYATPGHYTVIVIATDGAGTRTSTSWVQTAHTPLTQTPPSNSGAVLYDAQRERIWNVNTDNGSVSATDAKTNTRLFEVPAGKAPRALGQAPDGSIWVTAQGDDAVIILDPDSGSELKRIVLPYASQPHSVAFATAAGKAYVSLFALGELLEVDVASREVKRRLPLGPTPAAVAVAADGRVFVTRYVSPSEHGEVWAVAPDSFTLAKTIELPMDPGPDSESHGRGVPNFVSSFVISPDGAQAWVTAKKDDVLRGPMRDGLPMNSDNFVRSIVCVVDLGSETEKLEKRADVDNRSLGVSVAFSPVGDLGYVLQQGSDWLGIFDAYRVENLSGIKDVGKAPDGLAFTGDGKLFVDSYLSRELFVFDLAASLSSRDHQAPPPLAQIATAGNEPLSAQLLLGKQVYYGSVDKRMSAVGYMSCASCHIDGLSDGRVWDFTDRGEGLRNTKPLLGIGGPGQGRLHWSANFDEIQDFERDIRESLGGTGFMPDEAWLARKGDTFGLPAAGVSPELDALSAFVLSMDRTPPSPFRNADGSFSEQALRGRVIFERSGCPQCHAAPNFTNSDAGQLFDVGTLLPTSGHRLGGELSGIDTPTLKGLWQSAPYLHDGRAATLRDVFAITGDSMGVTSKLSSAELDDLVRYLLELDDVPEPEPGAQPSEPEMGGEMNAPIGHPDATSRGCGVSAPTSSTSPSVWHWALAMLLALRTSRFAGRYRRGTTRS
jgi:streptogramin lyase